MLLDGLLHGSGSCKPTNEPKVLVQKREGVLFRAGASTSTACMLSWGHQVALLPGELLLSSFSKGKMRLEREKLVRDGSQ